jgi:hypothetical protein
LFTDTDTIYDATTIQAEVDLNTAKETNVVQTTITGNAATATALTSGNKSITGNLILTGATNKLIIDSTETVQVVNNVVTIGQTNRVLQLDASAVTSGTLNMSGNVNLNSGADIILEADNAGGGGASSIQYLDASGTNRIMLAADSDVVILSNRAANGTVQIRANTSTAGGGSNEITTATFEDDNITAHVKFTTAGVIELGDASDTTIARVSAGVVGIEGNTIATTNKLITQLTTSYYSSSTALYYEPLHGYISENTSVTSYVSAFVAPYDGKIIKIAAYNSTTNSKTRSFKMFLNRQSSTQTGTTALTSAYTGTSMPILSPTDWVFSAGDSISIQTINSYFLATTNTTFIIEYNTTT